MGVFSCFVEDETAAAPVEHGLLASLLGCVLVECFARFGLR